MGLRGSAETRAPKIKNKAEKFQTIIQVRRKQKSPKNDSIVFGWFHFWGYGKYFSAIVKYDFGALVSALRPSPHLFSNVIFSDNFDFILPRPFRENSIRNLLLNLAKYNLMQCYQICDV